MKLDRITFREIVIILSNMNIQTSSLEELIQVLQANGLSSEVCSQKRNHVWLRLLSDAGDVFYCKVPGNNEFGYRFDSKYMK